MKKFDGALANPEKSSMEKFFWQQRVFYRSKIIKWKEEKILSLEKRFFASAPEKKYFQIIRQVMIKRGGVGKKMVDRGMACGYFKNPRERKAIALFARAALPADFFSQGAKQRLTKGERSGKGSFRARNGV